MSQSFEPIEEMSLRHLPNDCKLHVQRQRAEFIGKEDVQLYVATSFTNAENGERVWNRGFSIQLESIPEIIAMLQRVQEKFGQKSGQRPEKVRTGTLADLYDD